MRVFVSALSRFRSFEINGLCPVMNKNWFCVMPVHICVAKCATGGHPFLRMYLWWSFFLPCTYPHAR